MSDPIVNKLKAAKNIVLVTGILCSIVAGYCCIATLGVFAALVTVAGMLAAWVVSLLLEGLAELIECSQRIADKVNPLLKEIHHDGWTCPYCGENNLLGESVCKKCGRS